MVGSIGSQTRANLLDFVQNQAERFVYYVETFNGT
jgi:hypothetical protein